MLIFEVENSDKTNSETLLAISKFLSDRFKDTNAKQQMSVNAFINLARRLGVNISKDTLGDVISRAPLSNLIEPYDPNSNIIRFKGNTDITNTEMTATQAQEIVNKNAKDAMKRRMAK